MGSTGRRRTRFQLMMEFLRRLFRRRPAAPDDPHAYVMAPVRRGPKGRSGAAVADIEDDSFRSFSPRR